MTQDISDVDDATPRLDVSATSEADGEETAGGSGLLVDVRVGGHTAFDRVVFEFDGGSPGHRVRYVNQVVEDGSGEPVPLGGRAFLQAIMTPAAAHDDHGRRTFPGPVPTITNVAVLRDLADAGDFEGQITSGTASRRAHPSMCNG